MTRDRVQQDKLPLTQEFLAMMLGVRRPTVSMTASSLKQAGLITYTRGTVTVLDRQGLEESTCECYQLINEQLKRIFKGR
jgi:DNA-binding transcriptional regulator YhcF (GntR family)